MKKLLALALSLSMAIALVACGNGNNTPSGSQGNNPGGSEPSGGDQAVYKITYANTVADSNPQAINAKYMAERMKELSGGRIEMTVYLCEDQRPGHAGNVDLALGICIVDAIAGQLSADVVNHFPVCKSDLEAYPL